MNKKYKIPVAILATSLIGGGLYMNFHSPEPVQVEEKKIEQPKKIQGFGIIDLEQIKGKFADGEHLDELIAREKRLLLELDALMLPYQSPKVDEPPKIEEKPFEDSAREKNAQNFISQMAELKAQRQRLTEKYREESRDEYIKRRDAVHEVYLNRALNISLKLQNADNLQLSAEEIKNLQVEMDDLVAERNQKQYEMLTQWTAEITERVEKEIAPEEARIKAEARENLQKLQAEAEQKIQDTQERNKNLMEAAVKEIEARQKRRQEILTELTEVTKERTETENKILDSITEETGKLAAMYRVEAVLIKREPQRKEKIFNFGGEMKFKLPEKKSLGAAIYPGKNTPDLTQDLLKELQLKGQIAKE